MRRFFLLLFALAAPPVMTAVFYAASEYMLRISHRMIAPEVLWYAAAVEFAIFFLMAVLEVRNRWNIQA